MGTNGKPRYVEDFRSSSHQSRHDGVYRGCEERHDQPTFSLSYRPAINSSNGCNVAVPIDCLLSNLE